MAKITSTEIEGVKIIEPRLFQDNRGYFMESFNLRDYEQELGPLNFVQDNESTSYKGVLRGLHYQKPPFDQAKLVRVIEGSVLDVAVDLRKNSSTFGKYVAVELTGENKKQFFVPRGFAHGFIVLSEKAIFTYKVDNYYSPEHETGLMYNDPSVNIDWRMAVEDIILSDKDQELPLLDTCYTFD